MYEDLFGLKKSPFRDKATGPNVFVGPLTARTMAGFRKALTAQDAVVTVSGRAGTGKTTLVARSVDAFDVRKKIVRVSRVRMEASDVLESFLIVLGVENYPAGTIQRFTALRRKMKQFEDAGIRVFVIVEDALRTGVDTLAEIEALTAADAGESDGASIVLMGDERLAEFMKAPELAQLQQRVRQRHLIEPLSAPELSGYLRHCFRLAGGDFDLIFDGKSRDLLHHLTGGIPRLTNNIVEAALNAAAAQGIRPVTAELVAKVAADDFQLHAGDFDFSADEPPAPAPEADPIPELAPEPKALPEIAAEPEALPELSPDPEPVPELAPEPEPVPELTPEPEPEVVATPESVAKAEPVTEAKPVSEADPVAQNEPVIVFADEDEDDGIPELIQDTLPDLQVLAPELTETKPPQPEEASTEESGETKGDTITEIPKLELDNAAELISDDVPELEPDALPEPPSETAPQPVLRAESAPEPEPLPELELEAEAETGLAIDDSSGDEVPEWDRDPTLAELKPDLAALEQAMAVAHGANTPDDDEEDQATTIVGEEQPEQIPEITLDASIRTGVQEHQAENPEVKPRQPRQADAELEKIAAELAKAKTLEDVDDKMAETLFGSEISMIAAQVIGNPPTEESANDSVREAAPAASVASEPNPAQHSMTPPVQPDFRTLPPAEEVSMQTETASPGTGMDLSASQRLKTVRALNADLHPSLREPGNDGPANGGSIDGVTPESIEDQINTSITETLKALKVPPGVANEDGEEETDKSGFFSRFKRS